MLLLTRQPKVGKNVIRIGDNVKIKILSIKNGTARLGIETPRDITVKKGERHAAKRSSTH